MLTVRVGTPLEEIERRVTMATLASCGNVKRRAAEILGISLKTLYNRLEAYAKAGAVLPDATGSAGAEPQVRRKQSRPSPLVPPTRNPDPSSGRRRPGPVEPACGRACAVRLHR